MARTPAMTAPGPTAGKMTYEAFLAWCDEDTWAEWVDGEVIVLSPASTRHQQLLGLLLFLLHTFSKVHDRGIVLAAPFQMKLPGRRGSGREPDLVFVAREHLDRLLPTRLDGPADVVVEIVSPESVERDRREKYAEYEAAGVPEYWLIEFDRRQADFYRLGPDGRYHPAPVDESGIFRSESLDGFWLRVDWLWEDPLPDFVALEALGLLRRAAGPSE